MDFSRICGKFSLAAVFAVRFWMMYGCLFHCGPKTRPSITQKYLSMKNSCIDVKTKDLK